MADAVIVDHYSVDPISIVIIPKLIKYCNLLWIGMPSTVTSKYSNGSLSVNALECICIIMVTK